MQLTSVAFETKCWLSKKLWCTKADMDGIWSNFLHKNGAWGLLERVCLLEYTQEHAVMQAVE